MDKEPWQGRMASGLGGDWPRTFNRLRHVQMARIAAIELDDIVPAVLVQSTQHCSPAEKPVNRLANLQNGSERGAVCQVGG
jgi:hypothetical protein